MMLMTITMMVIMMMCIQYTTFFITAAYPIERFFINAACHCFGAMAPKTTGPKHRGKPAAKPKTKGKGKTPVKAASAPVVQPAAANEAADSLHEPNMKRRQICRRDSDEQVARTIEGRLAHLPAATWEGKKNREGLTVREFVKRELKTNSKDGKRVNTRF
jgi:hypothetical protein